MPEERSSSDDGVLSCQSHQSLPVLSRMSQYHHSRLTSLYDSNVQQRKIGQMFKSMAMMLEHQTGVKNDWVGCCSAKLCVPGALYHQIYKALRVTVPRCSISISLSFINVWMAWNTREVWQQNVETPGERSYQKSKTLKLWTFSQNLQLQHHFLLFQFKFE